MAKIVGCVTTTHVPSIGGAIAKHRQNEPYWKPFFDGFSPVQAWLKKAKPDVAVVIYNDHGLNFFLDKMPTFAVGAAAEYRHADEGWPPLRPGFFLPRVALWNADEIEHITRTKPIDHGVILRPAPDHPDLFHDARRQPASWNNQAPCHIPTPEKTAIRSHSPTRIWWLPIQAAARARDWKQP